MYVIECIIILSHVLRGQSIIRDRPSIMGRGAMQREGEASEVLHLGKRGGGAETVAMLKGGGHKRFWGSFNTGA